MPAGRLYPSVTRGGPLRTSIRWEEGDEGSWSSTQSAGAGPLIISEPNHDSLWPRNCVGQKFLKGAA